MFPDLEMSGFRAREDIAAVAVVAHQYLHNHNHGQIYILSSWGAAANNTISFSGWNIKYAETSLIVCCFPPLLYYSILFFLSSLFRALRLKFIC